MSGESSLSILLQNACPEHNPGKYVFCTVVEPSSELKDRAIVSIQEREGTTLVLPQDVADRHAISYEYVASWITLKVHSALNAVGLTAAFSAALAQHGISCNVVAGYFHDHIFLAHEDSQKAMGILSQLGREE